jgi:hypothetical protein
VNEPYDYNLTGIDDLPTDGFYFSKIFPNPVTTSTEIDYHIPCNAAVSVEIVSSEGLLVERLRDGFCQAGDYSVRWNSSGHPSGLYMCRIGFNSFHRTMKMIVSH